MIDSVHPLFSLSAGGGEREEGSALNQISLKGGGLTGPQVLDWGEGRLQFSHKK